jgi:hypothetical protein
MKLNRNQSAGGAAAFRISAESFVSLWANNYASYRTASLRY